MRAHPPAVLLIAAQLTLIACDDHPDVTAPPDTTPSVQRTAGIPEGWYGGSASPTSYGIGSDRRDTHGGAAAAYLTATVPTPTGFATITQSVRADDYRGRRVRWSGWVRPTGVGGVGAGLWMRVDGPGVMQAFDNMLGSRAILGTAGWSQVSVVLDVPTNAIGISLGALLAGPGDLGVDDFRLDVVGSDVPSTNQKPEPTPLDDDSATVAATYQRAPRAPLNLDFEGLPGPATATVAWLSRAAQPFATVEPGTDLADLAPLKTMVGSARVVALGEGTHGTSEFFLMKHRVLEFLVREMGFTHFAMEASSPEADGINSYVLDGATPYAPEQLTITLHFWTWNTQEVRDLIEWMRQWNLTAPAGRRVQFVGFDMQFPGGAIDAVQAYIMGADPASFDFVRERYQCLARYRNYLTSLGPPMSYYAALPDSVRGPCRAGLQAVYDLIDTHRAEYQAASAASYAQALHSGRLVVQWEALAAEGGVSPLRDRFMAENVEWLLGQAGPGARMMLWAHNLHVTRFPSAMGDILDAALGSDYVNVGFLFGRGSFTAVAPTGLQALHTQIVPNNSLEAVFLGTGQERLLFDARLVPEGGDSAAPLRGPMPMREIGAAFDPALDGRYFSSTLLPGDFDLLIFLANTTATQVLPPWSWQGAPRRLP